jgi:hypothetical protein
MPRYTFVCKYVLGVDAEDEDEAYDIAYDSMISGYDIWNQEATLSRGA